MTLFKNKYNLEKGTIRKYSSKFFFTGLANNWREFLFYRKTRHPLLQPTYFSLLGFVSLQRAGNTCKENFWPKILDILFTEEEQEEFYNKKIGEILLLDIHHWQNPNNFSFWSDKLYIHDYGDLKTQGAILKFGEIIFKNFPYQENLKE